MTAIILHLSDIHIKGSSDPILQRAKHIADCTYSSLPDASHLFIIVSGDIAFSGKSEQYAYAKNFFNQIKAFINEEKDIPINFVIAPGNHDCDFDFDDRARQIVVTCLLNQGEKPDDSVINICTAVQNPFFEFKRDMVTTGITASDKLWETLSFNIDGKIIIFDALNLSWVSQINEKQGNITFPHYRYADKVNETAHVRIVVMHHPLNWINQGNYQDFRPFIRTLASIIITGHEHHANSGENIDTESSMSIYIEGDTLQENERISSSAFNLIILNLKNETYKTTRYAWKGYQYEFTEESSWSEYRKLPPKFQNEFEIQSDFKKKINDPGANFQCPGRTRISLSDIYIFPDMLTINNKKHHDTFVNSKILLDPKKTAGGIIIEGEDKVGRTSLLFRLYDEYHNRGYIPIYISGDRIKQTSSKEIDILLRKAIVEQYGNQSVSRFDKIQLEKKLLLLDDIEDCQLKSIKIMADAICSLRKRFGHIIITVGALFEIRELLRETESNGFSDLFHYQIQPFGFFLRHKLIQKWIALGNDGTITEAAMIDKIDQAEKLMDTVMVKNIIPSIPLYLLILLQSIEAGRSGEFHSSALGHYYDYLLTDGFLAAGIPQQKLKEFFDYCTELAWFFHDNKQQELNRDRLAEFNEWFSEEFHTVKFDKHLDRLVKAKVLLARGNEYNSYYSFRYPYIYYFLKGRYLSRNLSNIRIRDYLVKCSKHLYVRENANTVLFLAHHTDDEFALRAILSALQDLFSQCGPIKFNGDTGNIAKLIYDAPKLKYSETPPEEFREKYHKARDDFDDGHDGLADKEEDGDSLSLIAQYITLFKTVEILGQILKNKYSSIERSRKIIILNELFSGPLRALSKFYECILSNPDQLVADIELALKGYKNISDELRRNNIAKRIAAEIIRFASLGFIHKAATSVSSYDLSEDIKKVVKNNGTPAVKLIYLGVKLDSSGILPKDDILTLKTEIEQDVIAYSLMQMLLIRHLYMFRISEQDKQWLSSKDVLDLDLQRAMDIKSSKVKRLK